MSDNNAILDYASEQFGTQTATSETEIVQGATVPATDAQDPTEIVAEQTPAKSETTTEATPEKTAETSTEKVETQPETVDFWKQFEERTEGLVKNEEEFKSFIERAKGYEDLAKQKEDLEKSQFKPANEYIETLNKLTLEGASKDQITAFMKLNSYGDVSQMSDEDKVVANLVLTKGYSERAARIEVASQHNLQSVIDEYGEDSDEAFLAKEKLSIAARESEKSLNEYRKELSTVDNPEKAAQEQQRLEAIAQEKVYLDTIKKEAPRISELFPKKLSHEIGEEGKKVSLEHTVSAEYAKSLPSRVENFFKETKLPINQENVQMAIDYAVADYKVTHEKEILNDYYKKMDSKLHEYYSNKYENRSGLPQESARTETVVPQGAEMDAFLQRIGALPN